MGPLTWHGRRLFKHSHHWPVHHPKTKAFPVRCGKERTSCSVCRAIPRKLLRWETTGARWVRFPATPSISGMWRHLALWPVVTAPAGQGNQASLGRPGAGAHVRALGCRVRGYALTVRSPSGPQAHNPLRWKEELSNIPNTGGALRAEEP